MMLDLNDFLQRELSRPSETQIITTLMKLMSADQSKASVREFMLELKKYPGWKFRVDLYAREGIEGLDIDQPVMVEVKSALLMPTFQRELRKGMEYVKENKNEIYLVVYGNSSLNKIPARAARNVRFVSYDEILERLDKRTKGKGKNIRKERPKTDSFKPVSQDKLIKDAANALSYGHATFILGAGVSVDAGSPKWDDLLKGLMKQNTDLSPLGSRENDYMSINSHCGWSSLITARYIIKDSIDSDELIKNMRKLIYDNSKKGEYKKSQTALPVIAQIIKKCKVDSAITFNYDEFLEEALEKEKCEYVSFYKKGALGEEFPVFHVHGLISRNEGGVATRPVLSEKEYHSLYSNDFHWSNVEILRALMRTTCFFVGLSMVDPNLRRLLDIARKEDDRECPHYLFMQRSPLDKDNPNAEFDKKHQEQMEYQFAKMGVNVIWFDYNPADPKDFTDLAKKLEKIKNLASQAV